MLGPPSWISEFLEFDFRFVIRDVENPQGRILTQKYSKKNFRQKVRPLY